jgi:DNA-directed RNA polymerase specialized sigma subunit
MKQSGYNSEAMVSDHLTKHRQRKRQQGICRDCGEPATHGIFCKAHREKYDKASAKLREQRQQDKLCTRCGETLAPNSSIYCAKHLEDHQARHEVDDVVLRGGLSILIKTSKRRVPKVRVAAAREVMARYASHKPFSKKLSADEKKILEWRIIKGSATLRETGKLLDMSYERVRQIEEEVAIKLADYLRMKDVRL